MNTDNMNTTTPYSPVHSATTSSFSENLKTFFNKIKRKNSFSFSSLKNNPDILNNNRSKNKEEEEDSFEKLVDYSSDSELVNSIKKKLRHKRIHLDYEKASKNNNDPFNEYNKSLKGSYSVDNINRRDVMTRGLPLIPNKNENNKLRKNNNIKNSTKSVTELSSVLTETETSMSEITTEPTSELMTDIPSSDITTATTTTTTTTTTSISSSDITIKKDKTSIIHSRMSNKGIQDKSSNISSGYLLSSAESKSSSSSSHKNHGDNSHSSSSTSLSTTVKNTNLNSDISSSNHDDDDSVTESHSNSDSYTVSNSNSDSNLDSNSNNTTSYLNTSSDITSSSSTRASVKAHHDSSVSTSSVNHSGEISHPNNSSSFNEYDDEPTTTHFATESENDSDTKSDSSTNEGEDTNSTSTHETTSMVNTTTTTTTTTIDDTTNDTSSTDLSSVSDQEMALNKKTEKKPKPKFVQLKGLLLSTCACLIGKYFYVGTTSGLFKSEWQPTAKTKFISVKEIEGANILSLNDLSN